jgi:hypothetical protein
VGLQIPWVETHGYHQLSLRDSPGKVQLFQLLVRSAEF